MLQAIIGSLIDDQMAVSVFAFGSTKDPSRPLPSSPKIMKRRNSALSSSILPPDGMLSAAYSVLRQFLGDEFVYETFLKITLSISYPSKPISLIPCVKSKRAHQSSPTGLFYLKLYMWFETPGKSVRVGDTPEKRIIVRCLLVATSSSL